VAARADDWAGMTADDVGALESLTGAQATSGNDVRLYVDGTEFYPGLLAAIAHARRSVDIMTYLWRDDEAGLAFAHALADAAGRGVRVRVIADWLNMYEHKRAYRIVQGAGIELLRFNPWPLWGRSINFRLHEKMLIVDGEETWIGGGNLCDEYMLDIPGKPLWHDMYLRARGPVLEDVQARFDSNWNWMATTDFRARRHKKLLAAPGLAPYRLGHFTIYPSPTAVSAGATGAAMALYMHQQPYGSHVRLAESFIEAYARLLDTARERAVLYIPYYFPNPKFERAVLAAGRRGVAVTLFTNSRKTSDLPDVVGSAVVAHLTPLFHAGARVFQAIDRTLHAKAILVDDTAVVVGSHNFTHRSFGLNGEADLLTGDADSIARFRQVVASDEAGFQELDLSDYRGAHPSFGEKVEFFFARWLEWLY
jgi:phosphatidylserine/phosphatidylglycerophosphate/cardiolipin synthase-like enzyme